MPVESSEEYFMNVLREVQTLLSLCLHTQCLLTTRSTWIALYFVVWIIDWELNPHSYRMSPSHPVTLTIVLYYNIGNNIGQHDFAAYSNFFDAYSLSPNFRWKIGSKALTLNHVFKIMMSTKQGVSWPEALSVISSRYKFIFMYIEIWSTNYYS